MAAGDKKAEVQKNIEAIEANPIDLKLDALLGKSKLNLSGDQERGELKGKILDSLAKYFKADMPNIEISSGFEVGNVQAQIKRVLAPSLSWSVFENGFGSNDEEGRQQFLDTASLMIANEIDEKAFKPLEAMNKDVRALQGVMKIQIVIDKKKGEISLKLDLDDTFAQSLTGLYVEAQTPDPKNDVKEKVDPLLEQKEKVKFLAEVVFADVEMMGKVAEGMSGSYYYSGLEPAFFAAAAAIDYARLERNENCKKEPVFKEINKNNFTSEYQRALHEVLWEKAKGSIDKSLADQGFILERVKEFKDHGNGVADPKFGIAFVNGQLAVNPPADFGTRYESATNRPDVDVQKRIDEVKSGAIGWFLTNVMDFKDKDFEAVANGNHPISYFLGAISAATGGASYGWARERWDKAKAKAAKNPKLATLVASVEAAAKKVAPFSPGGEENPLNEAEPKDATNFEEMLALGKGQFVKIENEKGIKLTSNYVVKTNETFTILVAKGQEVRFGEEVVYSVANQEKKDRIVKPEGESQTLVLNRDIPRETYFSKGVQVKQSRAAQTADKEKKAS